MIFSMQRMETDTSKEEEFPPMVEPTGRLVLSPNNPDFKNPEPYVLGQGTLIPEAT